MKQRLIALGISFGAVMFVFLLIYFFVGRGVGNWYDQHRKGELIHSPKSGH